MDKEPPKLDYTDRPAPGKSFEDPPRSVIDSVPVHDFTYYRKLMKAQEQNAGAFVEIGPSGLMRRVWRTLAWLLLLLAVATLFAVLFYHFTNSIRVALVIVAGMLVYMFAMAGLAEGKIDERNRRR